MVLGYKKVKLVVVIQQSENYCFFFFSPFSTNLTWDKVRQKIKEILREGILETCM